MSTVNKYRTEHDALGSLDVPADALHGIHTERALRNFSIARRPVHGALARAYGAVKLACAQTNRSLGVWSDSLKATALENACSELMDGRLAAHIVVDALQGGAGTSTNMNVNEVIANRALELLGKPLGEYATVHPLDDVNRHQSTNDTYPTALKLAAIWGIHALEKELVALQEAFQKKEKVYAHIVKIGRTELMDAVLTTMGRSMGAYAEAFNRDRWRVYKCEERLRVIALGGTAIGSGVGAPRKFIFGATDALRAITGIGFARAENMIDATQNADVYVEVSGILKACAVSLIKVSNDLRLLSSGPHAGFGEIALLPVQAGSSIMPGKVNPVLPEAVIQAAMQVIGNDTTIAIAASAGNLELNHCMPLIADRLLESIDLLTRASEHLCGCVNTLSVNEDQCKEQVHNATASATALVGILGYETVSRLVKQAQTQKRSVHEIVLEEKLLTPEQLAQAISPEVVCRLGS